MKILFVDEDQSFAVVYAAGLKKFGDHTVITASDSQSAIQLMADESFDTVITEVLLPGRNGLKLIQDIRLNPLTIDMPVYILTTLEAADVGLAHSLRDALGVRAYLVKQRTSPAALTDILELAGTETRG